MLGNGLLHRWVEKVSSSTGETYYWNDATGKAQWELPSQPDEIDAMCAPAAWL